MVTDELTVDGHRIKPLNPKTWNAFAALAERHKGCGVAVGARGFTSTRSLSDARTSATVSSKRRLVEAGRTHAALAFDGDAAVAWAQFGPVNELPNIHHR
jgi:hypothetical protein